MEHRTITDAAFVKPRMPLVAFQNPKLVNFAFVHLLMEQMRIFTVNSLFEKFRISFQLLKKIPSKLDSDSLAVVGNLRSNLQLIQKISQSFLKVSEIGHLYFLVCYSSPHRDTPQLLLNHVSSSSSSAMIDGRSLLAEYRWSLYIPFFLHANPMEAPFGED